MAASREKSSEGTSFWLPVIFVLLVSPCSAFVPRKGARREFGKRPPRLNQRFLSVNVVSTATIDNLEFRSPKLSDVEPISDLLVECFEIELKWFEFPERESRRKRYREMLQKSFLRRIEAAESNNDDDDVGLSFMLMVESARRGEKQLVGFVQLGLLPPPPGFPTDKNATTTDQDPAIWNGIPVEILERAPDVPYIANLCVLPSCRKTGIGKKMVDISLRWLNKRDKGFSNAFIAVDSDNFLAKRFYERIGFIWIAPPDDGSTKLVAAKRDYYFYPLSS